MNGIVTIASMFFGGVCGYLVATQIIPYVKKSIDYEEKLLDKAIQKEFNCERNEYTFFPEGVDDFYICTIKGNEYRIKFSKNKPIKIVYNEAVEFGE
jgi:hypothetical protein